MKLSEKEWLFLAFILVYSIVFIPLWPHSLVSAFLLFWYFYLFKIPLIKGFCWLGITIAFYHIWDFLTSLTVDKFQLSLTLSSARNYLQEKLTKVVEKRYSGEAGKFVNYLLFNKRTDDLKDFLTQLNHLSITHLLVVSGMHMNVLKKIIEKLSICIPFTSIRKLLVFTALSSYSWATAFSVPSCRVFLEESGELIIKEKKNTPLIKWAKATWLSFILFPRSVNSLGFFLSYSISLLFRLIDKLELLQLKNWILKISIASLIALFTFSYKTRKLFPLAIINQLFLTPIITFVFIFFLVSWPFSFLSSAGIKIYELFKSFISKLGLGSSYIERVGGSYLEPFYFSFALASLSLFLAQLHIGSEREIRVEKFQLQSSKI